MLCSVVNIIMQNLNSYYNIFDYSKNNTYYYANDSKFSTQMY